MFTPDYNGNPELVFMDIELTDGLSFKIFDKLTLNCPVIFTTAYDEYWQEAFEHNSIDYLLKPVKSEKLEAALKKYEKLKQYFAVNYHGLLSHHQQSQQGGFKKRFLVSRLRYIMMHFMTITGAIAAIPQR